MYYSGILRQYADVVSVVSRMLDICGILLCGIFSYYIKFGTYSLSADYKVTIIVGALLTAVIFSAFGVYRSWRGSATYAYVQRILFSCIAVFLVLAAVAYISKVGISISREWSIVWIFSFSIFIIIIRVLILHTLFLARKSGKNKRYVLIIGAGDLGQKIAKKIQDEKWTGYKIIGFYDDAIPEKIISELKVFGKPTLVKDLISEFNIDEVWVALPLRAERRMREILDDLEYSIVNIRYFPDIYSLRLINHSISEISGFPVVNLTESPIQGINRINKWLEDKVLSILILVLISPIMLFIAIGIKLTSPGPIFYKQERVGWNAKPFQMLKFRSMLVDAEKDGVSWGASSEKAKTKFGSFLRKTSLDELPQFLNVLKGDMSIVGPRPERTVFVHKFKDEIPGYMQKHLVKAGITGWAQVNGWRGDTDLSKRIECDLYYIKNWSLSLDFKIIIQTFYKGFVNKFAV